MIGTTAAFKVAFAAAGSGNVAVLLSAAGDPAAGLGPWLQGGGSAAAVGGLIYVARMIVKGDLVPRAVADRENETAAAIRVQAENAKNLQELLADSLGRESKLAEIANAAVTTVADNTAEIRWWRDQRERGRTVSLPRREPGATT